MFYNVFTILMRLKSIKSKLLTVLLLTGLLPLSIFGILNIRSVQTDLHKEIANKLLLLAEAKEGQIFAYLDSIETRTIDFASDSFIQERTKEILKTAPETADSLNNYLLTKKSLGELAGILIMNPEGKIVAATLAEEIGKDESKDIYFIEGKERVFVAELIGKDPHFGLSGDNFIVTAPITDKSSGELLGVIGNVFRVDKLREILAGEFQLKKGALSSRGGITTTLDIYLVNKRKMMFLWTLAKSRFHEHSKGMTVDTLPVAECLEKSREKVGRYKNYDGKEVVGASMCIPKLGWILLIELATQEAFAPIAAMQVRAGLIIFLFASLIIFTVLFLAEKIVAPIKALSDATEIVAKGNLDYRVKIETGDEIESLGNTFNQMAADLQKSVERLKNYSNELEKKVRERTEELDFAKKKDEAILASIGDGVAACDKKGHIILFNKTASEITGFSFSEVIGKQYEESLKFVSEKTGLPGNDFIDEAIRTGRRTRMANHTLLVRKDGTKVPVADSASPVRDEKEKITGCVVIFRDVTREREIDRAKTEFVSLASHQLRTPLSTINWYVESLLSGDMGKMSEKQRKYLEESYRASKRMIGLINALLNVSRIELGTFVVEPKPTDIAALLKDVIAEFKPQIEEKSLLFEESYAKDLFMIQADPKLLRIIFQNLVGNAINYTPENGRIKLTLDRRKSDILIKVADSGIGIPKNQQDKIFTKLFRADNAQEVVTDGTGLGLYMVKAIVDHSQGKIWFESPNERKGTTFYVSIPLKGMRVKGGTKELA